MYVGGGRRKCEQISKKCNIKIVDTNTINTILECI
jgi:hypothetical protein